ncbi:hypothetical protein [Halomarina ordinaria]|uniref:Uncharacterized protein n=1 Tax=Halomarina ordinaria TaxID=3033939 RepID=A0ABD5UAQ1_9EURY|nr:hypothetical protein [Halomarina sp. PSRA2]
MSDERGWRLDCTTCDFRARVRSRELADRLATIHESASGHDVERTEVR